eukprot:1332986-Amphidinium_carterae.1
MVASQHRLAGAASTLRVESTVINWHQGRPIFISSGGFLAGPVPPNVRCQGKAPSEPSFCGGSSFTTGARGGAALCGEMRRRAHIGTTCTACHPPMSVGKDNL